MKNKKVMILEENKEIIGRIKYYINEYFNHTIDLLVCEDLLECIKHIHSYDVVFINDLLGASSLLLYIDSNKLRVEVIVTSNNPENYDIYKGRVSSFILSPYGYKEVINAFNKAFNRFNDNISDIIDPTKLFFNFDNMPKFQDAINELKEVLKDKFGIDYVGLDIVDRNNDYYLTKNDHRKWQQVYSKYVIQGAEKERKSRYDLFAHEGILMQSSTNNFILTMTSWKGFDLRAQIIGDRKNGLHIFIYNEEYDYKICFTITFQESKIDVEKLDKGLVQAIIKEIENSESMEKFLKFFQSKIVKHRSVFYKYYEDARILIKNYAHVAKEHRQFLKDSKNYNG